MIFLFFKTPKQNALLIIQVTHIPVSFVLILASVNSSNAENDEGHYKNSLIMNTNSISDKNSLSLSSNQDNDKINIKVEIKTIENPNICSAFYENMPCSTNQIIAISQSKNYFFHENQNDDYQDSQYDKNSDEYELNYNTKTKISSQEQINSPLSTETLTILHTFLSICVLSYIGIVLLPDFFNIALRAYLFAIKSKIFYFSEYFYLLPNFFKLLMIIIYLSYASLTTTLYALVKQRLAVPELCNFKFQNKLMLFLCFTTTLTHGTVTFYYENTIAFSRNFLFLIDNFVYIVFMLSSLFFCRMSLFLIMNIHRYCKTKSNSYVYLKNSILDIMVVDIAICKIFEFINRLFLFIGN